MSFDKDGVHFECHQGFASPRWNKLDQPETAQSGETVFFCLPPAQNGLVLLTHVAHHLDSGLGYRQIIDWMLFASQYLDDPGWEGECGKVIRDTGLETLAKTLTRMCQLYLGFPGDVSWCAEVDDALAKKLLELLYVYGNFGKKSHREAIVDSVIIHNRRHFFQNLRQSGEINWKALRDFPWLRPLAPVYQLFRYAIRLFTDKKLIKQIFSGQKRVEAKKAVLEELGIE